MAHALITDFALRDCGLTPILAGRNVSKIATVPRYVLIFLKLVIVIVYEFAGVVKVNEDWLRAEPLRHWLPYKRTAFGTLLFTESAAYFFSYGGMFYDLIIGPMLLWRPTLKLGVLLTICFHSMNKVGCSLISSPTHSLLKYLRPFPLSLSQYI